MSPLEGNRTELEPLELERAPLAGHYLVEASAGTGKTYTLTHLVLRMVVEGLCLLPEILVVTFTKAATLELRERVAGLLRRAWGVFEGTCEPEGELEPELLRRVPKELALRRLRDALASIDEASIFTIHGFCQRVLQRRAFESGEPFQVELVTDASALTESLLTDYWVGLHEGLSRAESEALAREGLSFWREAMRLRLGRPDLEWVLGEDEALAASLTERAMATEALWGRVADLLQQPERLLELRSFVESQLSGTKYPKKSWERRWGELPRWAAAGELRGCAYLDKLLPANLEAARTKAGRGPLTSPIPAAIEEALAQRHELECAQFAFARRELRRFLDRCPDTLRQRLDRASQCTFDELLRRTQQALAGREGDRLAEALARDFPVGLIDESQDTDRCQYAIFSRIYDERSTRALYLVGDPKQAIYAFRGADIYSYLAAARDRRFHGYTLATNYRSDPAILRGVEAIFRWRDDPFLLPELLFRTVTPRPGATSLFAMGGAPASGVELVLPALAAAGSGKDSLWSAAVATQWAATATLQLVRELLEQGATSSACTVRGQPLQARDIAILVRTGRQGTELQERLLEAGIPAVMSGDASVWDSVMADELARLLAAWLQPRRSGTLLSALGTRLAGGSGDTVAALREDAVAAERCLEQFSRFGERWRSSGVLAAVGAFSEEYAVEERLLAFPRGDRYYRDWLHLAELLHRRELATQSGPEALLHWYRTLVEQEEERESGEVDEARLRLEVEDSAVRIQTMHGSKGLEFPVVLVPYLWSARRLGREDETEGDEFAASAVPWYAPAKGGLADRCFQRESGGAVLDLTVEGVSPEARRQRLAEEVRLAYVALTRAKHRLYVLAAPTESLGRSCLGHLMGPTEPPKEAAALCQAWQEAWAGAADVSVRRLAFVEAAVSCDAEPVVAPAPLSSAQVRPLERFLRPGFQSWSFSSVAHGDGSDGTETWRWDESLAPERAPLLRADATRVIPLATFPRGVDAGSCLHKMMELWDFRDDVRLGEIVEEQLRAFGIPTEHGEAVRLGLRELVQGEPFAGVRLGALQPGAWAPELEFLLATRGGGGQQLPAQLAEALAAEPPGPWAAPYARSLAKIPLPTLRGYLQGVMDLVFQWEERTFVLDYKSNFLGETFEDYGAAALWDAMASHHYPLQSLLYAVAVHQYLKVRRRDYRFDAHFGGVAFYFVRGALAGTDQGVFAYRPTERLLERWVALLSAAEEN